MAGLIPLGIVVSQGESIDPAILGNATAENPVVARNDPTVDAIIKSVQAGESVSAKTTNSENFLASDSESGNSIEVDPNDGITINASQITLDQLAGIAAATGLAADNPPVLDDDARLDSGGIIFDTFANRPEAGTSGRLFIPTNGYLPCRDNGAAWKNLFLGVECSNPPLANVFTNVNFESDTTLAADGDGLLFKQLGTNSTSEKYAAALVALPAAPYRFEVGIRIDYLRSEGQSKVGIVITDGTSNPKMSALQASFLTNALYTNISNYSSVTAWASNYYEKDMSFPFTSGMLFLRIRDDNTNRYYEISLDSRNWVKILGVGRTDYFTATHCGLFTGQASVAIDTSLIRAQSKIHHWYLGT